MEWFVGACIFGQAAPLVKTARKRWTSERGAPYRTSIAEARAAACMSQNERPWVEKWGWGAKRSARHSGRERTARA